MDIVEIESLAEKRKWQKRFAKAYTLGEVRISDQTFGDNVRFFVAVKDGNELGFIRINDKTNQFDIDDDTQVWNAADAYVKPAYRSKGVLKELLKV
ncbi:MAG: hypothetical protein CMM46_17785 [Rhodospirillaceae bacterium]|nr:hypothetical protein [Rhodospirillaceae bacterium]|tara:strand:- start:69 stop:356 length:288 start_codon:yes stop_codon:yes gene_type:complete